MKSRALTLVEVVIALVILSLTAVGLSTVFVSSGQWIFHSRALMAGAEVGRNFLDPLSLDVSQANWTGNNCLTGNVGCPGNLTLNNITYEPSNFNATAYPVESPLPADYPYGRMRKVVVTVNWPNETRF